MRKNLKQRIILSFTAIIITLSAALTPYVASGLSPLAGTSDTKAKNLLTVAALESCLESDYDLNNYIAYGNDIDSIFVNSDKKVFIGAFSDFSDENGYAKCSDLISGTIAAGDIGSSGMLYNAYKLASSDEEAYLTCSYKIVNESATAVRTETLTWPQGYHYGDNGLVKDFSATPIKIVFRPSDGEFVRVEGGPSNMNPNAGTGQNGDTGVAQQWNRNNATMTKNDDGAWMYNSSKMADNCKGVIPYVGVFPYVGETLSGDTATFYSEVEYTYYKEADIDGGSHWWVTYGNPSNEVILDSVVPSVTSGLSASQLEMIPGAAAQIVQNLRNGKLGGMSPEEYLNANPDLKYLLYGRYFFNGDGAMPYGTTCGAVTVALDDPNWDALIAKTGDWDDITNPYVIDMKAYPDGTAAKKDYRSKTGAEDGSGGSTRSIMFLPWQTSAEDCSAIASTFNGITTTNTPARVKVYGYMNVEDIPDDGTDPTTSNPVVNPDTQGTAGSDDVCFKNAGALGWLLCPVLNAASRFLGSIYDYAEKNFLQSDINTMFGSGVQTVWSVVRDIANVIFVIVFLIVIFSQVTGYGIDNYGIKRMLPKLIVAALLVNLSFIICQLAVDVSNILGVSLKGMLTALSNQTSAAGGVNASSGFAQGSAAIFETVAAGGILALLVYINPGTIVAMLMGIISAIIALLFLWIILIARQVGIIVVIILAPAAMACYMLPNTENYFKQWRKLLITLLVAYPLCSLAMGGGQLLSSVLASVAGDTGQTGEAGDNTIIVLSAMIVRVLPYFFIPTLLRGALKGLGNLAGTIQNLGNRAGRGLAGAAGAGLRRTGAFRNADAAAKGRDALRNQEAARNATRRQSERTLARLQRLESGDTFRHRAGNALRRATGREEVAATPGELSDAQLRQRYQAQATLNRMQHEDVEAEAGMTPLNYETELAQAQAARLQQEVQAREAQIGMDDSLDNGENLGAMQQRLTEAIQSSDTAGIRAYQNVLSQKGDKGRQAVHDAMVQASSAGPVSNAARQAYASNIMSRWANDYKNNSRSTYDYAGNNTGTTAGGSITDYYAKSTQSLKQGQLVDMDENELLRYINAYASGDIKDYTDDNGVFHNDRSHLHEIAQGALNNKNIRDRLKGSQEQLLHQIADNPPTLDVHSDNGDFQDGTGI